MIQEAYCSFEVAKLLKEKGFDEPCRAIYEEKNLRNTLCDHRNSELSSYVCAPTHPIVLAWLREKYNIISVIKPATFSGDNCTSWAFELWCGDNFQTEITSLKTYEEAEEAALKYSLENLI